MASGPCGQQFKDAFSCFHYSKEEVKGSECIEYFRGMQECMQKYPELYPQEEDDTVASAAGVGESPDTDSASVTGSEEAAAAASTENPAAS